MVGLVFILYTRYHIVARALGLASARTSKGILHRSIYFVYKIPYRRAPRLAYRLHRPSASREQRYLAYKYLL